MSNQDRTERFSKIRTWLDFPYHGKPSPHSILNQMLTDEQWLLLKLGNTNRPWSLRSSTLTTVAGQSEYTVSNPISGGEYAGKPYFVIRSTGNDNLPYLEIPFEDFSDRYYGKMMPAGVVNSHLLVPEKVSFYRLGGNEQAFRVAISPTPQEVLTYTVWYQIGGVDRSTAGMDERMIVPEVTDYVDLKTTLFLLPYSQWYEDDEKNAGKKKEIAAGLMMQRDEYKPVFDQFIKDVHAPKTMEMGHWND